MLLVNGLLIYFLFPDLSKAQQSFCRVLNDFTLNYIGEVDTPDEIEIGKSRL